MKICLAGCGAVGSQVAWHIAHPDHQFLLIDDDIVKNHNVTSGTSVYSLHHVGMRKVIALAELLWHRSACKCTPYDKTLTTGNTILRWGAELVIDGFDNSEARGLTHRLGVPTAHVGISEARTGEVIWDEGYQVPPKMFERDDEAAPCTHVMGRQILRFTSAVAAGVIERFIATGEKVDLVVTQRMAVLK
jgi:hypothetical protein